MMRYFTSPAILIFFISLQVSAQWNWIYPLPQGNTLNEIFFKSSSEPWFCSWQARCIIKDRRYGNLLVIKGFCHNK